MRRALVTGGWAWVGFAAACVDAPRLAGPLAVRTQSPAQLPVLHRPPAPATVLRAGETALRADAAYTSLWLTGTGSQDRRFTMDGEYLRAALTLRTGLGRDLELALELPFAHTSGGFLDGFVIDYHDVFGLPDQNRDREPQDLFEIEASRGGQTLWQVSADGFELLDVPLWLTWQLAEPARGPGVAVRAGLELPTGDGARGYGNDEIDLSFGVVLEHHVLGCGWFGHVQHTFAGTPDRSRAAGFSFADVTSAGLGVELPLDTGVAGLLQFEWETSTLRPLGIAVTERDQVLLWAGLRIDAGSGWNVEVGFGEDLQGLVSPDFTAWLAVGWQPGGASRAALP